MINNRQYGNPNNSTRPGGPEYQATITSQDTNSTFHLIADNTTVSTLVDAIQTNCTTYADLYIINGTAFDGSVAGSSQPESAIQYYRASSVVLTLDGYNNTAVLSNETTIPDTPLPPTVDNRLLECLNSTIGLAVPLVDDDDDGGSSTSTLLIEIIVPIFIGILLITVGCIIMGAWRARRVRRRVLTSNSAHVYQPVPT